MCQLASERVFSTAGHITNKLRVSLNAENVDALVFSQQNKALRVYAQPVYASRLQPTEDNHVEMDVVLERNLSSYHQCHISNYSYLCGTVLQSYLLH